MANVQHVSLSNDVMFHLRTIYIRKSDISLAKDFDPSVGATGLKPLFRTSEVEISRNETEFESTDQAEKTRLLTCAFTFGFEFVYLDPQRDTAKQLDTNQLPDEAIVARIAADITVDYAVARPEFPSDEELHLWANNNGVLHAWPYWREYCHSSMTRMGLPVTMMPLVQRPSESDPTANEVAEPKATPKRSRRKHS